MSFFEKSRRVDLKEQAVPAAPKLQKSDEIQHNGRAAMSFVPEIPRRRLGDLVVQTEVMQQIRSALNRIQYHDQLYEKWNLKRIDPDGVGVALNFYGPPGTGKSFGAEAVAGELGQGIVRVNYAEMESKYPGDTQKNLTAAFRAAKEQGCLLFFDESDSILSRRLGHATHSADVSVNLTRSVMLTQLDRFSGVVVFGTNLASNYDSAFVRRILAHVYFPLPDQACREELWRRLLVPELPRDIDVDLVNLAKESEGLSGGEMLNAVVAAACAAVARKAPEQRVNRADLLGQIAAIRRAKEAVGAGFGSGETIRSHEEVVSEEDLPTDVREALVERREGRSAEAS